MYIRTSILIDVLVLEVISASNKIKLKEISAAFSLLLTWCSSSLFYIRCIILI